jgi:sulfonate transport system permease protein
MKQPWYSVILPWVLPVLLLTSWQLLSQIGAISGRVLPSPWAVVAAGFRLTKTGELPLHLAESFQRASIGLLIGGTLGFLLGLFNRLSSWSRSLFASSIQIISHVLHLAMIPLVILWFGIEWRNFSRS